MKGKRIYGLLLAALLLVQLLPPIQVAAVECGGTAMFSPAIRADIKLAPGETKVINHGNGYVTTLEGLPDGRMRQKDVRTVETSQYLPVGTKASTDAKDIATHTRDSNITTGNTASQSTQNGATWIATKGNANIPPDVAYISGSKNIGGGKYLTEVTTSVTYDPNKLKGGNEELVRYVQDQVRLARKLGVAPDFGNIGKGLQHMSESEANLGEYYNLLTGLRIDDFGALAKDMYDNPGKYRDGNLGFSGAVFTAPCDQLDPNDVDKLLNAPYTPEISPGCAGNCGCRLVSKRTVDTFRTYFYTDMKPEPAEINHRPCPTLDNFGWSFWNEQPWAGKMISPLDREKQDAPGEIHKSRDFTYYANSLHDQEGHNIAYSTAKENTDLELNKESPGAGEFNSPKGNIGLGGGHVLDTRYNGTFTYSGLPFTPAVKEIWRWSPNASWCSNGAMTNIYDGWYDQPATAAELARLDRAGMDTQAVESYVNALNSSGKVDADSGKGITYGNPNDARIIGLGTSGPGVNKSINGYYGGGGSTTVYKRAQYESCIVYNGSGERVFDPSACDIKNLGQGGGGGLSGGSGGECAPSLRNRWHNNRVFINHTRGKFQVKWMDMTKGRDENGEPIYSSAQNISRRCQVAYDGIIVPPQQIWMVQHFDILGTYKCIMPGPCPCIDWRTERIDDGSGYIKERRYCAEYKAPDCRDGCKGQICSYETKIGEGAKPPVKDGVIPPVYRPRRMWNYRQTLSTEYHGYTTSYINMNRIPGLNEIPENMPVDNPANGEPKRPGNGIISYMSSKRISFNNPMDPQIPANDDPKVVKATKSGYGVTYFGRTRFYSDWGRPEDNGGVIVADNNGVGTIGSPANGQLINGGTMIRSYLIRPNRTQDLRVNKGANNESEAAYYNPNIVYSEAAKGPAVSSGSSELASSAPSTKYVIEPMQAMAQVPTTNGAPPDNVGSNQNFATEPGRANEPGSKYKWRAKGGLGIEYGTKIGYFHAYPGTKGYPYNPAMGQPGLVPALKPSREHFIHLDYPDGNYTVGSLINIQLVRRNSNNIPVGVVMDTRYGNYGRITVKGNMFEDSFVAPSQKNH